MSRKTISVASLTELANEILANSSDNSKERRNGVIIFIEAVLHETGNYKGFNFINDGDDSTRVQYTIKGN